MDHVILSSRVHQQRVREVEREARVTPGLHHDIFLTHNSKSGDDVWSWCGPVSSTSNLIITILHPQVRHSGPFPFSEQTETNPPSAL